jgi:putative transcriptional regulator
LKKRINGKLNPTDLMKTKIKEYRKELKMTQEELAESVNVTRQTIISLEQGRYNPSLILAYKITRALKRRFIEEVFDLEKIEIK